MWSIDWVSIRQHHQHADLVGKNLCIWYDGETGDRISEGVGYLSHQGSYSTSVQIRSYGGVVEWSGNPSRWGRADNVFGYRRLRDALDFVINPHLISLGLPPFDTDLRQANRQRRLQREGVSRASLDHSGAVLTRVDLCRNMSTGSARARDAYLRAASCAVYRGKPATVHPGSVSWGSARNAKIKLYDKASELRAHSRSIKPSDKLDQAQWDQCRQALEYRERLAQWCDTIGLVRQEVGLGRQALDKLGLRDLGDWSDDRAAAIAAERVDAMTVGCSVDLNDSFAAFVGAGYTARQAGNLSGIVSRWYMGDSPAGTVSRATWYRYVKSIKNVLGLDINQAPDISVLTARVQTVDLSAAFPPDWYRHAA